MVVFVANFVGKSIEILIEPGSFRREPVTEAVALLVLWMVPLLAPFLYKKALKI